MEGRFTPIPDAPVRCDQINGIVDFAHTHVLGCVSDRSGDEGPGDAAWYLFREGVANPDLFVHVDAPDRSQAHVAKAHN